MIPKILEKFLEIWEKILRYDVQKTKTSTIIFGTATIIK